MTANELHLRGRIVASAGVLDDGIVTVAGDRIKTVMRLPGWSAAHPETLPPPWAGTLLPGLVDIHNHGGLGHEFATTDPEAVRQAAGYHHRRGSTTVLASLVTASPELLVAQTGLLRELTEAGVVAGIHCEGPFLSAVRCGAQDPRYLLDPDPGLIRRLLAVADGTLRVMTIAPEKPGSAEIARLLADGGVTVALGHSDASYSGFAAAIRPAGLASLVTHLANGMPPLHHRAPGPVAAALVAAARHDITVELIADGVHAAAGFAGLVFAAAPGRVAIVSDAMAAAGMPDGGYQLGLQQVSVSDGVARVAGGALAGGTSHVLGEVRWLVRACGVTLASAVRAASATPAAAVGLADVGDLRAGLCADVLVVDDELRLLRVMRHGRWLL